MLRTEIGPGLTEQELDAVEARFGFTFSADHRVFLAAGLPRGSSRWPDWRDGDPEELAGRLAWPVDGVLFDVERNGFWHPVWPSRPAEKSEALRVARTELESVPQLGPVRPIKAGPRGSARMLGCSTCRMTRRSCPPR
ncbi:hypothetical protein ADK34_41255, partial [Streptomyces viridochromogenes]